MLLTPTTELEAVNTMLRTIGEAPINSLELTPTVDAVTARNVLHEISRETQAYGYHFNTEHEFPLARNANKEIVLPINTMSVDLDVNLYPYLDVVQRGSRLYDKVRHTYKFDSDLKASIVFFLAFEELPEPARRYITIRSARVFQDAVVTDSSQHSYTSQDEARALVLLKSMEAENADYNLLNEYSVARVLGR